MKILQVCAIASPVGGNFIKSVKKLADAMEKQGYKTIYAFPETAKDRDWVRELQEHTKVYFLPLAKARIKPKTYFCFKKLYKENPDISIVHSHYELYDIPATIMAPPKIKIFWHLHDAIGTQQKWLDRIIGRIHYGVCHKQARLISVSEKHMEYAIKLGFPKKFAHYLPNGIDTDYIKFIESSESEKHFDFLMFGTDFIRKGVDVCIEAQKKLNVSIHIGIVCEPKSQKMIRNLYGVIDGIEFLEPVQNVNALYAQSKCFLHISRAEGLSYALLEASYAGLPVICSNIPENEIARIFPTVTMIESGNAYQLAEAIKKQIDNEETIFENLEETRNIIEKKYSLNTWVESMVRFYLTDDLVNIS